MTPHLVLTRLAELRNALHESASPEGRLDAEARLFDALSAVAERHRPTEVEEYYPASFGDPCTSPETFNHRPTGERAFVHAGMIVRQECATCRDEDNQPVKQPCEEYRRLVGSLST